MHEILFYVFAILAVASALAMVLHRNPVYSAIFLIVTLFALAGFFVLLNAPFVAAVHIIVYAGAIMVLFVFVIMLLNVRTEEAKFDNQRYLKWLAGPLFIALFAEVYYVVRTVSDPPPTLPPTGTVPPEQILGTVESIGSVMFTGYLLPFEATSVLILMAIVGAALLARREKEASIESATQQPPNVVELPEQPPELEEVITSISH